MCVETFKKPATVALTEQPSYIVSLRGPRHLEPATMPVEHVSQDEAHAEAERMAAKHQQTFEVWQRVSVIQPPKPAAPRFKAGDRVRIINNGVGGPRLLVSYADTGLARYGVKVGDLCTVLQVDGDGDVQLKTPQLTVFVLPDWIEPVTGFVKGDFVRAIRDTKCLAYGSPVAKGQVVQVTYEPSGRGNFNSSSLPGNQIPLLKVSDFELVA